MALGLLRGTSYYGANRHLGHVLHPTCTMTGVLDQKEKIPGIVRMNVDAH